MGYGRPISRANIYKSPFVYFFNSLKQHFIYPTTGMYSEKSALVAPNKPRKATHARRRGTIMMDCDDSDYIAPGSTNGGYNVPVST